MPDLNWVPEEPSLGQWCGGRRPPPYNTNKRGLYVTPLEAYKGDKGSKRVKSTDQGLASAGKALLHLALSQPPAMAGGPSSYIRPQSQKAAWA
jgi:hypothetical protein